MEGWIESKEEFEDDWCGKVSNITYIKKHLISEVRILKQFSSETGSIESFTAEIVMKNGNHYFEKHETSESIIKKYIEV